MSCSITDSKEVNDLLSKKIPNYRQAYSDRTSWLMACLCELAYKKFNEYKYEGFRKKTLDTILDKVDEKKYLKITTAIDEVTYNAGEEEAFLKRELKNLNGELIWKGDKNETQCILVSFDNFMVLAFRGTERDKIGDIKTDMKAYTSPCHSGGRIHTGFLEAYQTIECELVNALHDNLYDDKENQKKLYITGHSLGGALATIATKFLENKGFNISACYSFGAPRVGNEEWWQGFKSAYLQSSQCG